VRAYDEFKAYLQALEQETPVRIRITLACYNHVAEGAGFYEIPKSLLLTVEGRGNNTISFQDLVERHRRKRLNARSTAAASPAR
jgi:hypothetical protein